MIKPTHWWTWQRLVGNYSCFNVSKWKNLKVKICTVCAGIVDKFCILVLLLFTEKGNMHLF